MIMTVIAILWGLENALLAGVSFRKIRRQPNKLSFIYPIGFLNGAFVWEDMFVFGIFHFFAVMIGLIVADLRYTLLLFILFWIIRATGETLYFFLQQFIRPKHHPHDISAHFRPFTALFGKLSDQKCFILMQVLYEIVLVVALFCLINLLVQWKHIGALSPWLLK